MADLVHQRTLADITDQILTDIEILNKPFGFYEFLGVDKAATTQQIHKAYLRKARLVKE